METQQPVGLDLQARLVGLAAADSSFRQQLLTNGRAAIEKEFEIELPPDLEIQVIEETPTKLCLVLPMMQEAQGTLSEAELDQVVGGNLPGPMPMPVNLPGPLPQPIVVYSYNRLTTYIGR